MSSCSSSPTDRQLTDHQFALLQVLKNAQRATDHDVAFQLRPIDRWPFAWLLHPGLKKRLIVVDLEDIGALERAGYIATNTDGGTTSSRQLVVMTYGPVVRAHPHHVEPPVIEPENGHHDVQERRGS